MQKVNANKTEQSDLAKVNDLVKSIGKEDAKIKKLREKKKELVLQAQEIAERNRSRWFGDKKSINVDAGKLKWTVKSKAEVGPKFDLDAFNTHFPSLFRFKAEHNIPAGELRVFLGDPDKGAILDALDVGIDSTEFFEVVPN